MQVAQNARTFTTACHCNVFRPNPHLHLRAHLQMPCINRHTDLMTANTHQRIVFFGPQQMAREQVHFG